MSTNNHSHGDVTNLKYKIAIVGAADTGHCDDRALEKAEELGRRIAEHNMVLITGATTGVPYWAAKGAKQAGGIVVGFSPAASKEEHTEDYGLPLDYYDFITYTGLDYSGRNLMIVRSADALIVVCGRMGTLNAFTNAFEDKKPQGVLAGSGGAADVVGSIIESMHKEGSEEVIFESEPEQLLEKLIKRTEDNKTE